MALTDKLTDIADAIRAKTGKTDGLTLAQMPTEISTIETGTTPTGTISIEENGTFDVTEYASAEVNVNVGTALTEPYVIETYDKSSNLIGIEMKGLTKTRANMFSDCTTLVSATISDDLVTIENYTFSGCSNMNLAELPPKVASIGSRGFYNCTSLALTTLPDGITSIGTYGFYMCSNMSISTLPSGLTSIGSYTFQGCIRISISVIPAGIGTIGTYAFRNCTGLTDITFMSTPNSIASTAFTGCTNLKCIKVPWTSGEVSNAPWGAAKATIVYNYSE